MQNLRACGFVPALETAVLRRGVSTVEQMRLLLRHGAEKVLLNTWAVETPELISKAAAVFGSQSVVVDSSYLVALAKDWGLRPLITHLDNGWDSELAIKNV